jgi:hypothetical protein
MNRIYQGRGTRVEILIGKNGELQPLDKSEENSGNTMICFKTL